jgi:phosphatidate cytidylyltransferase
VTGSGAAPAAERGSRNLLMRVIAGLVLAPTAIALAWAGGWPWAGLVTMAAIGLYVEWLMIVGAGRNAGVIATGTAALSLSGFCLASGQIDAALVTVVLGVVSVGFLCPGKRAWGAAGFCYAAAALVASILVRLDASAGFAALIMVLLIVWVTDIGGYFAGRGIGGPKLWPRVSPSKTWAGAIGGFIASLAIATAFAGFGFGKMGPLLLLGAVLSIASQLGDLFESAVKRRFGVKDSSQIIPGHGGLLDRLDGFVAAIVLAALIGMLRGGIDGVGRGLMVW